MNTDFFGTIDRTSYFSSLKDVYKRQLQDTALNELSEFAAECWLQAEGDISYDDLFARLAEIFEGLPAEAYDENLSALAAGSMLWVRVIDDPLIDDATWAQPVSYTHLDVYKRQSESAPNLKQSPQANAPATAAERRLGRSRTTAKSATPHGSARSSPNQDSEYRSRYSAGPSP